MDNLHRIVVGIDFGTTYTAVAWAEASNPNQIEIIKNWPTSGQLVGPQVPSEIAYSEEDRNVFSWGYNINPDRRKVNKMISSARGCPPLHPWGRLFLLVPFLFVVVLLTTMIHHNVDKMVQARRRGRRRFRCAQTS